MKTPEQIAADLSHGYGETEYAVALEAARIARHEMATHIRRLLPVDWETYFPWERLGRCRKINAILIKAVSQERER